MSTTDFERGNEQWLEAARAGQAAVADGLRTWSQTLGQLWSGSAHANPWGSLGFGPQQAVDAAFDVAEEALATQRALVHHLLDSTRPLVESAGQLGRPGTVIEPAARASDAAADAAREAAREQREERQEHEQRLEHEQPQDDYPPVAVEHLQGATPVEPLLEEPTQVEPLLDAAPVEHDEAGEAGPDGPS